MEGRKFGADVKGERPAEVAQGPVCLYSSNHDEVAGPWKPVDVTAFYDRCYVGTLKTKMPKKRTRADFLAKMRNCSYCHLWSPAKYSAGIRKVWGRLRGGCKTPRAPKQNPQAHFDDPFDFADPGDECDFGPP